MMERPTWARGLYWYLKGLLPWEFSTDPWDFGLHGDSNMFRDAILFYPDLWEKLERRRNVLRAAMEDASHTQLDHYSRR